MKPSKYQEAIYKWLVDESGNAMIQAVAGSGKTTTIVNATQLIPANKSSVFCAFNKSIADELKKRLPTNIQCATLHSLGYGMFYPNTNQKIEVKSDKLGKIVDQVLEDNVNANEIGKYYMILLKLIPLLKSTMIDYKDLEQLEELCDNYQIEVNIDDVLLDLIEIVLDKCKEQVNVIDFDDMIWIPVVKKFKTKTYDYIFVDEAQDLSKVQAELIKMLCNGHSRIVMVGDRRQSIYAFRGADINSIDNLKQYFSAKEMPLSICYRCPISHVKLAQQIVPELEYNESNIEGTIQHISINKTIEIAEDGDLVLCRVNSHLIGLAFSFIRSGKKAVVRGRDIGANLLKLVDRYKVHSLQELREKIARLQMLEQEKIDLIEQGKFDKKKKNSIMASIDSCETLLILVDNSETIEDLKRVINETFSDEKKGIVCSTVHRAKGLEADNVYILHSELMPHPMAKSNEEKEQEMNIKYVSLTRAKKALYFID